MPGSACFLTLAGLDISFVGFADDPTPTRRADEEPPLQEVPEP